VPTAIESTVAANVGVGFAVPAAIVQKVVPVLIEDGGYSHAWIGISGTTLNSELAEAMELDPARRGVLVAEVIEGSPADDAGLQGSARTVEIDGLQAIVGGDVIVAIDGEPVREFEDLVVYLARNTEVGQTIELTILRDGDEETMALTLAARPTSDTEQAQLQVPQMPGETSGGVWLGIQGLELTSEIAEVLGLPAGQAGVLIASIVAGSPADDAGLRGSDDSVELNGEQLPAGGDIIVAIDGEPVDELVSLRALLADAGPGEEVTLTVLRDGEEVEVQVVLSDRPTTLP
jgi:serine protease Do